MKDRGITWCSTQLSEYSSFLLSVWFLYIATSRERRDKRSKWIYVTDDKIMALSFRLPITPFVGFSRIRGIFGCWEEKTTTGPYNSTKVASQTWMQSRWFKYAEEKVKFFQISTVSISESRSVSILITYSKILGKAWIQAGIVSRDFVSREYVPLEKVLRTD